jgi:Tfp pilus assembly protein PilV
MLILVIVVVVIVAVLLIAGAVFWLTRVMRQKEAADLNRYLQGADCYWERMGSATGETIDDGVYFVNHAPASQGIEMRVYEYAEPEDGSEGDDEGVCLSLIDTDNRNGMILNGFSLHLEAMQFGDTIWNDHFLGDTGLMERIITEKRVAWDQMQQDIIVGHYALFM